MVKPASPEAMDAVFSALAHPIRRAIVEQLAGGPANVSALAEPHDVSLPAVSRHIRVLEEAGLVEVEPEGRVRICRLEARPLQVAFGWLTRYRVFWEDRLDRLEDHLADGQPDDALEEVDGAQSADGARPSHPDTTDEE